jgi:hypothetical protein
MVLISRSRRNLPRRALAAALCVCAAAILAGCSTGTMGDSMPTAVGGLPENTPQRPATPAAYPAVHDMPPPRTSSVLTDEEQKKLEDDLVAARNRAVGGKPAGGARNP